MKIARGAPALVVAALLVAPVSGATAGPAPDHDRTTPAPLLVGGPDPAPSVVPASQHQVSRTSTVTLVTGDKVRLEVGPDGRETASVLSPSGDSTKSDSTYTGFTWGGDQYVIPNVAVPYLSTLDERLFDVSYLVRAKLDDAHSSTLPVKVSYSGAPTATLPEVQVSARSDSTGTGTVTKAQAKQFGQRLAEQWRASRTETSPLPVGRLSGVDRIDLAPAADAPALPTGPATPLAEPQTSSGLTYHTLTMKFIDQDGGPGPAIGFLQNIDHPEVGPWLVYDDSSAGVVAYSVPEGTYSLATTVTTGAIYDRTAKAALVVNPEFTVSSDTTVTMDARTAKPFQVSVDPPVTDEPRQDVLTFARTSVTGAGLKVQNAGLGALWIIGMHLASLSYWGNPTLYATPTPTVTKGTFDFAGGTTFVGDETQPSAKPGYFLTFPHPGSIPSSLTYTIRQADLAVVHQKIYYDPADGESSDLELGYRAYLPWGQMRMPINNNERVVPGEHTDYLYSSAPDLVTWAPRFDESGDGRQIYGVRRTIQNGEQLHEEWNKGALIPSAVAPYSQTDSLVYGGTTLGEHVVSDPLATVCLACRQDGNGMLFLTPGDSGPNHVGDGWDGISTLEFYRNGTLAASSDGVEPNVFRPFALDLPMLPDAATYRLDVTTRPSGASSQSTETGWTFTSAPGDAAATLPATSECAPDNSRACSFLPLLFLRYDLGFNELTQAKAGAPFDIDFTVAHQEYQGAPAGVGATVSVSYDDGATWTEAQAATSLGGNRFRATIDHPDLSSTNGFVSLRVKAHDDAGNTVEQTVVHAYALTS